MVQHKTLKLTAFLVASILSSMSYGAGFAIIEQSVTGLGRAFAGSAAVAEDASTIFFNPAGLAYLDKAEMAMAIHYIAPESEFNDDGSTPVGGGNGGDAGKNAVVPNFYLAYPINDKVVAGIGVGAPFGLVTEYDDTWVGRYHAVKSDMKTINVNPSISFKASDKLALGFGINAQYIDVELTQMAFLAGADSKVKMEADDFSWGYNLGFLYQVTDASRVGLSYRSKISHTLEGDGDIIHPTLGTLGTGNIQGDIDLPETASLAIHHQINDQWAVMADASWTRWDRFQELAIEGSGTFPSSTKEEKWDNSMRYGLGLDYKHDDKWTFRGGIAYDETPISDQYRTARIPGEDRKWVAIGASYKYSEQFTIDAGYTHIFISDPTINEPSGPVSLTGDYEASVDILSVQVRWFI